MAMCRGNPLFQTHPQPLPPKGGEWNAQGRSQGVRPMVGVLQQGRGLRPIAGAVPCAGPKTMFDRFSIPCLYPHVGRTPIMHYALCIGKIMFDRFYNHPLASACWANANNALCILHWKGIVFQFVLDSRFIAFRFLSCLSFVFPFSSVGLFEVSFCLSAFFNPKAS